MSWDAKKHGREYFYVSIRSGQKTKKVYIGRGLPSRIMADQVALSRADDEVQAESWRAAAARWKRIEAYRSQWAAGVELLTSATLLATGFRRQCRHKWKRQPHA